MSKVEPLEAQKAVDILADHFLGRDWYVVDPLCATQVNAIVVDEIIHKYPKRKKLVMRRVYFDE
jgi:acyl carrier protein phosphodiesterase